MEAIFLSIHLLMLFAAGFLAADWILIKLKPELAIKRKKKWRDHHKRQLEHLQHEINELEKKL